MLDSIPQPSNGQPYDTYLPGLYLEWIDSASFDGWRDLDDVGRLTPYRCRTLCLLVQETEEHLIVTHSETYGEGKSFRKMFSGLLSIPKCAVMVRRDIPLGD